MKKLKPMPIIALLDILFAVIAAYLGLSLFVFVFGFAAVTSALLVVADNGS